MAKINRLKIEAGGIEIIESGKLYGNMNTAKEFFPEGCSEELRKKIFLDNRLALGRDYGFDGNKMFMADQKDKTGTWFEIDEEYVEANPKGWSDIDQDILIVTDKTPGVVIGHPVADCPVVMAYDKKNKVAAICHCSANLVDIKMPEKVIDALCEAYDSKTRDVAAYISASAGSSWTYDCYPKWAKDEEFWSKYIKLEKDGLYHISLKSAVLMQLIDRHVGEIYMNPVDTITDPLYYSNSAGREDESKRGRNFSGTYFVKK